MRGAAIADPLSAAGRAAIEARTARAYFGSSSSSLGTYRPGGSGFAAAAGVEVEL